jgi:hypothetical protein
MVVAPRCPSDNEAPRQRQRPAERDRVRRGRLAAQEYAMYRMLTAIAVVLLGLLLATRPAAAQGSTSLSAQLAGTGGGDSDGSGAFSAQIDGEAGQLCYELSASGIGEATAAHIHRGGESQSGPPVVGLDAPASGSSQGCESVAADLLAELTSNPSAFYVNVHNAEFRSGAIRGQLVAGM